MEEEKERDLHLPGDGVAQLALSLFFIRLFLIAHCSVHEPIFILAASVPNLRGEIIGRTRRKGLQN